MSIPPDRLSDRITDTVDLWLANDPRLHTRCVAIARVEGATLASVADGIEALVRDETDTLTVPLSLRFVLDIVDIALAHADWPHVAARFIDAVKEGA